MFFKKKSLPIINQIREGMFVKKSIGNEDFLVFFIVDNFVFCEIKRKLLLNFPIQCCFCLELLVASFLWTNISLSCTSSFWWDLFIWVSRLGVCTPHASPPPRPEILLSSCRLPFTFLAVKHRQPMMPWWRLQKGGFRVYFFCGTNLCSFFNSHWALSWTPTAPPPASRNLCFCKRFCVTHSDYTFNISFFCKDSWLPLHC